jgi:hypothetical protein
MQAEHVRFSWLSSFHSLLVCGGSLVLSCQASRAHTCSTRSTRWPRSTTSHTLPTMPRPVVRDLLLFPRHMWPCSHRFLASLYLTRALALVFSPPRRSCPRLHHPHRVRAAYVPDPPRQQESSSVVFYLVILVLIVAAGAGAWLKFGPGSRRSRYDF